MVATTAAGTSLAISTGTPSTHDYAGYFALSYTEIGGVEKIGTAGAAYAKVDFQPLKGGVQKRKGSADYGALTLSLAHDDNDAGQTILRAASDDTSSKLYVFRVVYPTGAIRYFRGRVFGYPENIDGADTMLMVTPTIEISTRVIKIDPGTAVPSIGGVPVGAAGAPGSIMDGYTLSTGDDFDSALSIIGWQTPRGKYGTTRGAYIITGTGQAPRGSAALAGYDVDPQHTGHLDSNRGTPVPSFANSIVQTGGAVTLRQRSTVSADQPFMLDASKQSIAAMLHTGLSHIGRAPVVFEWREKRTNQTKSHVTGWLMQTLNFATDNDLELDFEAGSNTSGGGDGRELDFNTNVWDGGSKTGGTSVTGPILVDDQYYTYALRIDEAGVVTFWLDGTLRRTVTDQQAKALQAPFYLLWTNHAYQAANWGSTPDATQTIDWFRVWRKGGAHFAPSAAGATYQVDFGGTASFVLPDAATVWGASVPEVVESVMSETNEPGGTANGAVYTALPNGVGYTPGSRTLAVSPAVSRPGRLQIARYVNQAGCTCEPQRILLEIGPAVAVTSLRFPTGAAVDYDLYAVCDVGNILPKTITVSGLAMGLGFNASTGRITGTPTVEGTTNASVTVTNGSGQQVVATIAITVAAALPWEGNADLIGWFDADDASAVEFSSGANVSRFLNKAGSSNGNLVPASGTSGTTVAPTAVANAINGRRALRFVRGSTGLASGFLRTGNTSVPLAALLQGMDKAHTVITVFKPVSTTTSFVDGWSEDASTTSTRQAQLVRREPASQSSFRYGLSTATPDANIGTITSGAVHIVARKRVSGVSGNPGTDTVFVDSKTTKVLNAVARTVTDVFSAPYFGIGGSMNTGSTGTEFNPNAFGGDFAEILVFKAGVSDTLIADSIQSLATKWGITLS